MVQIEAAQSKIEERKRELAVFGFQLDSDGLDLSRESSAALRKLKRAHRTRTWIRRRNQMAMMTVASFEGADKLLLKSVSEI